ncbi:hypothetical protein ACH4GK_33415 [Streptomyces rimosus]|uniref:hypothetical protein n=1 Tax=Streptomyces rimosus TaxID=1927 RepID=UPI000A53E6A0|nr:hypothetical protein [Streptomyces rimosus]
MNPTVHLVPMRMDALLFNQWLGKTSGQPFYRRSPRFKDYRDPEVPPMQTSTFTDQQTGVYLHWHVPQAFGRLRVDARHPAPDAPGLLGGAVAPAAPNRWLIIRYYHKTGEDPAKAPQADGWLVESDYLSSDKTKASARIGKNQWLGRHIDLSTTHWHETSGEQRLSPLTVFGPGLPTFATFQPYCPDVFSLHDPLTAPGSTVAGSLAPGRLSYLVAGWHSDPGQDITAPTEVRALLDFHGLAAPGTVEDPLARSFTLHRWNAPGPVNGTGRTLCHATVLALPWDNTGQYTGRRPADTVQDVRMCVGHDMGDALDSLILNSLPTHDQAQADLLRAFHTGRLEIADHAVPDKARDLAAARRLLLDATHHRDWFGRTPAGERWAITTEPDARTVIDDDQLALLDALNTAQKALDDATHQAQADHRRQMDLWWLNELAKLNPDDVSAGFKKNGAQALTAAQAATEASQHTADQFRARRDSVHQTLAKAIGPSARLTSLPTDPYWHAHEPGAVIRGTHYPADRPLRDDTPLPLRTVDRIITAAVVHDGSGTTPITIPHPLPVPTHFTDVTTQVPTLTGALTALTGELYVLHTATLRMNPHPATPLQDLLDPKKPLHLTLSGTGTLPAHTAVWDQPWTPLTLHWLVKCHPLPYELDNNTPCWTFKDSRRTLADNSDVRQAVTQREKDFFELQGRSLLAPVPLFTLQRRIDAYHDTFPDTEQPTRFKQFRDRVSGWDLTSVSLHGIRAALTHRDLATAPPDKTKEFPASTWPDPYDTRGVYQFVHGAHLRFEKAVIVDTFGRGASVILQNSGDDLDDDRYRIGRARSVIPPYTVTTHNAFRFVQLPPRLPGAARLCATALGPAEPFLPASRGEPIGKTAGPQDPASGSVVGWLVVRGTGDPARLTVDIYTPAGTPLGTVRRIGPASTPSRHAVTWRPLPDSPCLTPGDVHGRDFDRYGPLADFVRSLTDDHPDAIARGESGHTASAKPRHLADLAAVLDAALSAAHPPPPRTLGTALAAGRLIALVHLRLHLETDGPPDTDPTGWDNALAEPRDPRADTRRWPVRLGTASDLRCGLVGYYKDPGCTVLYTDHPQPDGTYTADIGTGDLHCPSTVTVTAHPRTAGRPPGAAHVLMLADPFLGVDLHTDILPLGTFRIPRTEVDRQIDHLPLAVPFGPALAHPLPADSGTVRLDLPAPAPAGFWDLTLRETPGPSPWQHTTLTPGDPQPVLRPAAPIAHTGHLTYHRKEPDTP